MGRSAAAVGLVLLTAVVACGEGPDPRDRLAAAARAMEEVRTAAYAVEMRTRSPGDSATSGFALSGDGTFHLDRGVGRFQVDVGGSGMSLEMIRDSSAIFVRLPSLFTGGRDRWIRNPTAETDDLGATSTENLLDVLRRYRGEVRHIGSETTDGSRLDGFALTVPGARLWTEPDSAPAQAPSGLEALRGLEVPTEIWVDGRDRLRRVVMHIGMEEALSAARNVADEGQTRDRIGTLAAMLGTAPGDTLEMSVRLSDFGTSVDLSLPEGADVVDVETFRRQMGGVPGRSDSVPAEPATPDSARDPSG